jgi:NADH-quinone oxidoreductase subunit F
LIGGYAVGASEGVIYVRAEYPLAVKRIKIALQQAIDHGFLGKNILGSSFSFDVTIMEGAGAFVCGEETALMASIEGERGMPRPRPPFPAVSGLFGKPTVINNVETLANVAWILQNGEDSFSFLGTEDSKGTKVFALTGKVMRTGLVEVPMGTTLRTVIYELGGGALKNRKFKAVQIGGPSGGCLPLELLDTPVDYKSLTESGAIVGSGGMIVLDDQTCMVDMARYFLDFTRNESCGKCVPCRIGLNEMYEVLEKISRGKAVESDLETLAHLAQWIKETSLCALGGTAPNPVLTTLRYFKEEYEEHLEGICPAGVCRELISFVIDEALCNGCHACVKACPSGAIKGEAKKLHYIDETTCIKCGACREVCRFEAILTRPCIKERVR